MIRVVIADDHPLLRSGLARLIDHQGDLRVVGQTGDGAELIGLLDQVSADVLILDLSLPHLRGIELVRLIGERHPALKILIYSVQPEDALSLHLLEVGAAGYLSKDRSAEELLRALRTVARGQRYLSEALLRLQERRAEGGGPPHHALSERELQVFDLLLRGRSVAEISGELEISASTASNHLARIREKLGVRTNTEVLLYAVRAGLLT